MFWRKQEKNVDYDNFSALLCKIASVHLAATVYCAVIMYDHKKGNAVLSKVKNKRYGDFNVRCLGFSAKSVLLVKDKSLPHVIHNVTWKWKKKERSSLLQFLFFSFFLFFFVLFFIFIFIIFITIIHKKSCYYFFLEEKDQSIYFSRNRLRHSTIRLQFTILPLKPLHTIFTWIKKTIASLPPSIRPLLLFGTHQSWTMVLLPYLHLIKKTNPNDEELNNLGLPNFHSWYPKHHNSTAHQYGLQRTR